MPPIRRLAVGAVIAVVLAVVTVLADIVQLVQGRGLVWGALVGIGHGARAAAEWLYPVWLLMFCGTAILALALALVVAGSRRTGVARDEAQPLAPEPTPAPPLAPEEIERRRDHDRRALEQIRETLPRGIVTTFLREHDFGASWRKEWMWCVTELGYLDEVEHRFLDEELEQRRVELQEKVGKMRKLFMNHSWPHENGHDWQDVGVYPVAPGDEETRIWEQRKTWFNEAASETADAYDALMEEARQQTLL